MRNQFLTSVKKVDNEEKMSGEALFTDDIQMDEVLTAIMVRSTISKGKVLDIKLPSLPLGYYFVSAKDIVKENVTNIIFSDWPVFVDKEVNYMGETIGLLIGEDKNVLLDLASQIVIDYEEETPIYDMVNSYIHKSFKKGNIAYMKEAAVKEISETFLTGYQEQAYLETQAMLMYLDGDKITVKASMQCPFYVKKAIMRTLGYPEDKVRVIQPAVGGAFGGKEHFPSLMAAQLATAIVKIKKPIKMVFDRMEDISFTTKRHPSKTTLTAYIGKDNEILGMKVVVGIDGGAYKGCSGVVLSRALIACTNAYTFNNLEVIGDAYCTNKVPSAAFRGFGSPQTIFAIEMFMHHIAKDLNIDPLILREKYMVKTHDITSTNGIFRDKIILKKIEKKVMAMSDYKRKIKKYSKPGCYKGIGMSWFLHGCGFTGSGESDIIKAKVKMNKDENGIVRFYTSQVDFGQGNRTTLKRIVVDTLGIPEDRVIYDAPDTDLTLNSGPTAASRTTIIVGGLVAKAAKHLKRIWKDGIFQEIIEPYVGPSYIKWDEETMQGDAYPGYAWGANVVEVEVDPITYQVHITGCWSVYDVGHCIDERICYGQADGGIVQALGYGYMENCVMENGKFRQKTLSDYIVPTAMDVPTLETAFIDNPFKFGAFGAKGAGELTFVGGAPALALAIENAIDRKINKIPANPEYIMELIKNGN